MMARNVKDLKGLDTFGEQEETHPYVHYNKSCLLEYPWTGLKQIILGNQRNFLSRVIFKRKFILKLVYFRQFLKLLPSD